MITSCSKDNPGIEPPAPVPGEDSTFVDISGNWYLMSNDITTSSTSSYSNAGTIFRNKAESQFTTYSNNGTVTVLPGAIRADGIQFDVITQVVLYFFIGNDEDEDETFTEFVHFMDQPYNTQKMMTRIGVDSVYFPNGIVMNIPDVAEWDNSMMNVPQGGKISLTGSRMTITTKAMKDSSFVVDDVEYFVSKTETIKSVFEKKD